ncbi:hypothetical protein BGX27_003059 [Mortierella sp. AM989]|nr:hypothetical protein BGX27_003059 [Mortierella sp. AM989]
MRTCLFLSTAIALVALASAATTVSSSYSYPNDEDAVSGYYTLIRRETWGNDASDCTILERGETQAFRDLYPVNRRGEMARVIKRKQHDEGHHHGSSLSSQENYSEYQNELLELNTNVQMDRAHEESFLKSECDFLYSEPEEPEDLDDLDDFLALGQTSDQQVLKTTRKGLLQDDEVRKLVDSGPDKNRVTIVFMGDGYILEEREKFFADMTRLINGKS